MNPGALDYLFGALLIAATVRCVLKGFVAEVIAVASIFGGIICGVLFSGVGAEQLTRLVGESPWNRVIAFLVIFLAVYLVLKISEGLLYRFLEALHLENLDRALGFFWGLLEGTVVCLVLLMILNAQPFLDAGPLVDESIFARTVYTVLPLLRNPDGGAAAAEGMNNGV